MIVSNNEVATSLTSYAVAGLAFLGATFMSNMPLIMQVLGFVLVVARLLQEVPRAYRKIKGWFH